MGRQRSIRSKAAHLVSDITTVILNPISDKPSKPSPVVPSCSNDKDESGRSQPSSASEEESSANGGPDTSSFTAFLSSLLTSSEAKDESEAEKPETDTESDSKAENQILRKENSGRKGLLSRGRQSVGKAFGYAAKLGGFGRNQGSERNSKHDNEVKEPDKYNYGGGFESSNRNEDESVPAVELPEMSDSSSLLSERTRRFLYASLPSLAKGRKWILLYSTWKHGISLATLYRRSMLCDGLSLLVVGDRKGAVFGGLVEAPLRPSKSKKYQGTNSTFLFTDMPGRTRIYHPTGANRYFTLCNTDFLALGGGNHFALYLDSDLLNGSSAASETYGNSCLAYSQDFAVKEVELWGFVYASKYEETLSICRAEAPPGICRW